MALWFLIPAGLAAGGAGLNFSQGEMQRDQFNEAAGRAEYEADLRAEAIEAQAKAERAEFATQDRLRRRAQKQNRDRSEAIAAASGLNPTGTVQTALEQSAIEDELTNQELMRGQQYRQDVLRYHRDNALQQGEIQSSVLKNRGQSAFNAGLASAGLSLFEGGLGMFGGGQAFMGQAMDAFGGAESGSGFLSSIQSDGFLDFNKMAKRKPQSQQPAFQLGQWPTGGTR